MMETFRFPGRIYFLIAGIWVLAALSGPFVLVESTRHGAVGNGEFVLGAIPVLISGLLLIYAWQTLTISVDEYRITRTLFGHHVQEIRWDAADAIKLGFLLVPGEKSGRLVIVFSKNRRSKISVSNNIERFEHLVSLISEMASRHHVKIEQDPSIGNRTSCR